MPPPPPPLPSFPSPFPKTTVKSRSSILQNVTTLEGSVVNVYVLGEEILDRLPPDLELPEFLLGLNVLPLVIVGGNGLVGFVTACSPCSFFLFSAWAGAG